MAMTRIANLQGRRNGKVVAIEYVRHAGKWGWWRCRCDCGNEMVVQSNRVAKGYPERCRSCRIKERSVRTSLVRDKAVAACITGSTVMAAATANGIDRATVLRALRRAGIEPHHCKVNHDYFETIDTESKAYWLGFITADGCVSDNGSIQLGLAMVDEAHVRQFRDAIESTHAICLGAKKNTMIAGKSVRTSGCAHFAVRSPKMASDLSRLGVVPRKSLTCAPWTPPDHLARHFWRGIIDGDGWMNSENGTNAIQLGLVGSKETAIAFTTYANRMTGSVARPRAKGKVWYVTYGSSPAQKIIRELYTDAAVYLDRKMVTATELMTKTIYETGDWTSITRKLLLEAFSRLGVWQKVADELRLPFNTLMIYKTKRYGIFSRNCRGGAKNVRIIPRHLTA